MKCNWPFISREKKDERNSKLWDKMWEMLTKIEKMRYTRKLNQINQDKQFKWNGELAKTQQQLQWKQPSAWEINVSWIWKRNK